MKGVLSHLVKLESNVNQLSSDLQAERCKVQEMSKECASYRDVVTARTTANAVSESFMFVISICVCSIVYNYTRNTVEVLQLFSSILQKQIGLGTV